MLRGIVEVWAVDRTSAVLLLRFRIKTPTLSSSRSWRRFGALPKSARFHLIVDDHGLRGTIAVWEK